MVMLSDPEAIRALYTAHEHGLPPGRSIALLPVMGPGSVLLLEGKEHLARRKLMLPPFHGERMRSYEATVREVTERELDSWSEPRRAPFALHPRMQAITLEVILQAVFGVTDPARSARLRERLPLLLGETSSAALQFRVLLSRRFRRGDPLASLGELLGEIDELLLAEIAERRADPGARASARTSFRCSSRRASRMASEMSDREVRDQLVTLLLAGHETTATALAWTFDLLLRNPATLARLTAEVDAGEEDTYLRAVISESLRLRPVVPLAGRRLASELNVDGLSLPAGTDVTPAIWLTHTRPDLYPEPYAFRPERFLEDSPTTYGWIPFGGGIRRCLGAAFAEMEMRVVLEAILQRCVLQPRERQGRAGDASQRDVLAAPRHARAQQAAQAAVPSPRRRARACARRVGIESSAPDPDRFALAWRSRTEAIHATAAVVARP